MWLKIGTLFSLFCAFNSTTVRIFETIGELECYKASCLDRLLDHMSSMKGNELEQFSFQDAENFLKHKMLVDGVFNVFFDSPEILDVMTEIVEENQIKKGR